MPDRDELITLASATARYRRVTRRGADEHIVRAAADDLCSAAERLLPEEGPYRPRGSG